ncbi:MAG: pirin family protein [Bdellovibrionales bacterium]|nr:pirin family protein [Bdellovibrionales bacterium]
MISVRASKQRGHVDHGWLNAKHTFSFGSYYDESNMGFRSLRVINEDVVSPGAGFGMHPHRDMEIITYPISGALEHKDSMGNVGVLTPGMIQRMSAGSGVLHSEFNHSDSEAVHLLQIWIEPLRKGIQPSYEDLSFDLDASKGSLVPIAGGGEGNSAALNQDVKLYAARLSAGDELVLPLSNDRYGWLQVVKGEGTIAGEHVGEGDGVQISQESEPVFSASENSEILLFDLA